MNELHKKKCIPCRGDTPPFDFSEIHKYLKKINGWNVKDDGNKIFYLENGQIKDVGNLNKLLTKYPEINSSAKI